jgi:hypothetical protein
LLGIDRVQDKATVDQGIDHRAVRHLDPHGHSVRRAADRQQPVAKISQARTAMQKPALSDYAALCVDKARLVSFRTPVDTREPRKVVLGHCHSPNNARAVTTPAVPVLALKAQLPTGHPS